MGRAALRAAGVLIAIAALAAFEAPAIASSPAGPSVTLHASPKNVHSGKS